MLGAWPSDSGRLDEFADRLKAYLTKAAREANSFTSWVNVDSVYEDALHLFVDALFDPMESADFLGDFGAFQQIAGKAGAVNALTQTLLKFTAPGVPDTYQGTDLWDYSLVDPDNRRPVDYESRLDLIERLTFDDESAERWLAEMVDNWTDGRIKLFLTQRVLHLQDYLLPTLHRWRLRSMRGRGAIQRSHYRLHPAIRSSNRGGSRTAIYPGFRA